MPRPEWNELTRGEKARTVFYSTLLAAAAAFLAAAGIAAPVS